MKWNRNKLREKFYNECTDNWDGIPRINLAAHNLFEWFWNEFKSSIRSTKANRLYWVWMQCLEDETGQDKNDFHDYFKDKFIGYSIKEFNERSIIKEPSTKGMLQRPFYDYMKKVQAEAATEFSVTVPLPEDQGYDEFIEHYKDYF
jgi:hypothetical protein